MNLSQSEYIRNLIIGYEIKIPEVKEEPKPKKDEYIIENIAKALEENIEWKDIDWPGAINFKGGVELSEEKLDEIKNYMSE